jgi:hypothetical protein
MNPVSDRDFHVYSAANDPAVLARDLQRSPDIAGGRVPLSVLWDERSASGAYAREIARSTADVLVFVHQDVYLPRGWFDRLAQHLNQLQQIDPNWTVAGSFGVTYDAAHVGHIWDSGLGRVFGGPLSRPVRAASLDEIVLIVRRASKVSFDPYMPTFHLYGTDIILSAERLGRSCYVLDLPVVHNSRALRRFPADYAVAYRFMVRKWRYCLPRPTVIMPLTTNPLTLAYRQLRSRYNAVFHTEMFFDRLSDPAAKARELGFEAI